MEQCRIVNRQRFAGGQFDVHHEICRVAGGGGQPQTGREGFGIGEIGRLRGFFRMTKAWLAAQEIPLLARGEIRKSLRAGRTVECEMRSPWIPAKPRNARATASPRILLTG